MESGDGDELKEVNSRVEFGLKEKMESLQDFLCV